MKSTKLYLLGMAMGAIATVLPSCGRSDKLEITPNNYAVREMSLAEVDSFNIKHLNRDREERKKDTIETVVKLRGYVKGVSSGSGNLDFLLEDGSGLGKFCKFYGSSSVSSLLEAVIDMRRVTVKPEMATVYAAVNDETKFLNINRVVYDGKVFDWSQDIDTKKLFENVNSTPFVRETSIDSLVNTDSIKHLMNVRVEGYIMGKSTNSDLAFVLTDEKGNAVLCYKSNFNDGVSNSPEDMKFDQLKTLTDAFNQVPTKVKVTGDFSKAYGGLLVLQSIVSPVSVSYESKTLTFDSEQSSNDNALDYVYVSVKEARDLQNYNKVKIVGDVVGVSTNPITMALIKDFNGETVFCRKAEKNEYTAIGDVMLNYARTMQGKQDLVDGKKMYKYMEISGRLENGMINIEEIKDVWSESPILNKNDMSKVIYRDNLDHRVNFNQ